MSEISTAGTNESDVGQGDLDDRIRKAVEADFQQFMIQSLTPDRGYATPIDNVRDLIRELSQQNACVSDGPADATELTRSAEGPFAARNG